MLVMIVSYLGSELQVIFLDIYGQCWLGEKF